MLDGIIVLTVLLSGLFAMYRGFVRELMGLATWIIAAVGGVMLSPFIAGFFSFSSSLANEAAAIAICSLVLLGVCTVITLILQDKVKQSKLSLFDRYCGFLFGALRGFVFVLVGYYAFSILAYGTYKDIVKDSKLVPYVEKVADPIKKGMIDPFFKDVKENKEEKLGDLFEELNDPDVHQEKKKQAEGYLKDERKELDRLVEEVLSK